ncbi:hypothetical protein L7F22_001070 [Adiantum nelumboides]|nr:hypothetical protein [Adiantum nelumboides]
MLLLQKVHPKFVEIASPLHALQKKAVTFRWTQKEISAFNLLKEKMTSDAVIVLPDLKKSFVVQCDACGRSIGAVLMQDGRVVAYESRILQGPENSQARDNMFQNASPMGRRPPLTRHVLLSCIVLGFTGIFANQLLFLLGLSFTSPAYASALQPGIPVFTFALTLCMGTERINWRQWSGLAKVGGTVVCVLGAIFMAVYKGPVLWGDGLIGAHMPPVKLEGWMPVQIEHVLSSLQLSLWHIGVLCLIGNCFCMALYISLQAPLLKAYPASISVTAYSYFFGAVFIILSGLLSQSDWNDWILTKSELLAVFFSGILASALNYGLLAWSNKILGPALMALYMPLQPLFSSILARIFLSSSLYLGSVLGGFFIVVGLYCVTWGQMKSEELTGTNWHKDSMGQDVEDVNSLGSLEDPLLKEQSIRK